MNSKNIEIEWLINQVKTFVSLYYSSFIVIQIVKHAINPVNRWLMRSHVSNVSSQTEERQIDIVRTYAKNKLGFINYTRKWNELQCVVSWVVHVLGVFWRKITCLVEEEMFWKITTASFCHAEQTKD